MYLSETIKVLIAVGILSTGISTACADNAITCDLITFPNEWKIPENSASGKILLAWEVTNVGEKPIRFRIRDLGRVKLVLDGKELIPDRLGVDATKTFQERDYPLIGTNETLYFPFVVSFRHSEAGLFSLKLRSDPEGDEGWIFNGLKPGKYSIIGIYSVKKDQPEDSAILGKLEMEFLKPKYLDKFWQGEVVSKPIDITIIE